ncbi:dihydroorotate dehydrogenase electron transfer subunit [Adlercreutzia sp. ZJ304]|uniref:dihydroorotate dehydrogenase electron transfer subunit n=1 Tax=Adlercreutzia sp. ZJ304 TaxID=2709791 RepID=UPI001F14CCC4|nr:dihydroorotate dehydrogenase electron transfer subunit [Adlercreutzia sp. ZJ304]
MSGLFDEMGEVKQNLQVGPNLYLLSMLAPKTASKILPGQFVHMQISTNPAHVLRRPFSIYAANPENGMIDILYQVVGSGTREMTFWQAGDKAPMISPIGHGWTLSDDIHKALLVGGGVGAAPLYMLCVALCKSGVQVDVALGAGSSNSLVCLDRYNELAMPKLRVLCATDDGSYGISGFCTSIAQDALQCAADSDAPYDYVATCGPEPMMKIVANLAHTANVRCEVSLERRMACGVGACLSCVVDTKDGKKRACVDGPVFDAQELLW